jgi:alginate O-acetyltransferase complex protein AlgI
MLFNSLNFIIFLPIVFTIYAISPQRYRSLVFLIASYYFYMSWKPEYIILILLSTIVDYYCSDKISRAIKQREKKFFLSISLLLNLGLLFYFKYYNFFSGEVLGLFYNDGVNPYFVNIILPVGISFYTFQTMSYTIDVYYGKQKVEKNFINFAVYVSYFPQLVAGPIERPQTLLNQFKKNFILSYSNLSSGFRMILWGLFKKIVVADNISSYVDAVFNNTQNHSSPALIIAGYLFSLQIYCDFSGYSDMAIGVSKLFNIDLMKNFKTPYFSSNITEFWRRWHISLSTWFRDYLYIPLGGSRAGKKRVYLNLVITFLVSGLWHGANWTFILWGAIHGFFICLDKLIKREIPVPKFIKVIVTAHIAMFAFIYFRAESISHGNLFISKIFDGEFNSIYSINNLIKYAQFLPIFFIFEYFINLDSFSEFCDKIKNGIFRKVIYACLIFYIVNMGAFYGKSFIYFQF